MLNITNLDEPKVVGYFHIKGYEPANVIKIHFGTDAIGAISMSNAGLVMYDFSNATNPVPISDVFTVQTDPATAATAPFTLGIIDAKALLGGNNGQRWIAASSYQGNTVFFLDVTLKNT